MIIGKKIAVVMPAYNASKTLETTYAEIPFDIVDIVILVDDHSRDDTAKIANEIGIDYVIIHEKNKGYGGNQKTCYKKALELGADIIIMLHPDYQYTPKLIHSMAYLIADDVFDVVLASRILGNGALQGGMPWIKYVSNRGLTFIQNMLVNHKLSEYHTGYRAFSKVIFEKIDIERNSDNFVFDNQMLSQIIFNKLRIGEITCPTKYFDDASSINLKNSTVYALGVLKTSVTHFMARMKIYTPKILKNNEQ
jgi:glycosyltransferase involved in cell wall biosynthesis